MYDWSLMNKRSRWVLLEHVGAPDDLVGRHFDLLLEDGLTCRSWRLEKMPLLDGPAQKATALPPHNLDWLETPGRKVSGNRGWAKPLKAGFFRGDLSASRQDPIQVELHGNSFEACLEIHEKLCKLISMPRFKTSN